MCQVLTLKLNMSMSMRWQCYSTSLSLLTQATLEAYRCTTKQLQCNQTSPAGLSIDGMLTMFRFCWGQGARGLNVFLMFCPSQANKAPFKLKQTPLPSQWPKKLP